jgi:iron uptake system EfeUOB component EfeO/EfeM
MKMKKASLATKHKFNIKRTVGVGPVYHFSMGVIKDTVRTALQNNGVQNPDEIINKHSTEFAELQDRLNKTEAGFDNYKKETDKTIADLKNELRELSKQNLAQIGREMAKGFYEQSQKILSKQKVNKTKQTLLCLSPDGDLYLDSDNKKSYPMSKEKMREKLIKVLCSAKGYIKTAELAEMVGTTNQALRNSKLEINRKANDRIGISDLICGRDGSGYKLNPQYKIKIL